MRTPAAAPTPIPAAAPALRGASLLLGAEVVGAAVDDDNDAVVTGVGSDVLVSDAGFKVCGVLVSVCNEVKQTPSRDPASHGTRRLYDDKYKSDAPN